MVIQDTDSKAMAAAAAAEEGYHGGVDFKAVRVEAKVGIKIKGTTNKEINRAAIIKTIIKSKVTIMTTVTKIVKVGATTQGPRRGPKEDKANSSTGRKPRDGRVINVLMDRALLVT